MEEGASQKEGRRFAPQDVPAREPFRPWLHGSLIQERDPKTASIGPISERHLEALDEIKRELKKRGYSLRQVGYGNVIETAIELVYAHVFDGRRIRAAEFRSRDVGDGSNDV